MAAKPVLSSEGFQSYGHAWIGDRRSMAANAGSRRIVITSEITDGIKPAIGRLHELKLTPDQAEKLVEELPRLIEDVRYREALEGTGGR